MRTYPSLVLALATLAACGSQAAPPGRRAPSPPRAETPPPEDAVADPDPDTARRQRAERALTRTPSITAALATLRALPFRHEVPAEYQGQDAFKAFVEAEIARELPPDLAAAMSTAFHHVGLLPEKIDLAATVADALVTQAGAYYDPRQKKFFVVMVPEDELTLDVFAAHELTHALQDQHFDLLGYLEPTGPLDNDRLNARRFIVEGEATVTMFAYAMMTSLGKDPMHDPAAWAMLKMGLTAAAGMSLDQLMAMTKQQAASFADVDDELRKSIEAMDQIPLIILVPLLEAYMKGTQPVAVAFDHGGWAEVDKLYASPPDSTEQVLHPATKLIPVRDLPRRVTLPELPGYTEVHTNTMGELEWRIYYMQWKHPDADRAAAGWDGDRWRVVSDPAGALVGLLVTTWDSPAEAKEFAAAYQVTVATRFPGQERTVWVKTRGANVYIVDGGHDAKLIDRLIKGASIH